MIYEKDTEMEKRDYITMKCPQCPTHRNGHLVPINNPELSKVDEELYLHDMSFNKGSIDMSLSGKPAKAFLNNLMELFVQNGGKNYLTMVVNDSENKYSLTIENCNGKDTPSEKIARLTKSANEYKEIAVELSKIIRGFENTKIVLNQSNNDLLLKLEKMIKEIEIK
jgi:hypothetical protein